MHACQRATRCSLELPQEVARLEAELESDAADAEAVTQRLLEMEDRIRELDAASHRDVGGSDDERPDEEDPQTASFRRQAVAVLKDVGFKGPMRRAPVCTLSGVCMCVLVCVCCMSAVCAVCPLCVYLVCVRAR
jgi:hypothetical protein